MKDFSPQKCLYSFLSLKKKKKDKEEASMRMIQINNIQWVPDL